MLCITIAQWRYVESHQALARGPSHPAVVGEIQELRSQTLLSACRQYCSRNRIHTAANIEKSMRSHHSSILSEKRSLVRYPCTLPHRAGDRGDSQGITCTTSLVEENIAPTLVTGAATTARAANAAVFTIPLEESHRLALPLLVEAAVTPILIAWIVQYRGFQVICRSGRDRARSSEIERLGV